MELSPVGEHILVERQSLVVLGSPVAVRLDILAANQDSPVAVDSMVAVE